MVSADTYIQKFIKHPHVSIFHSYPEYIHAALLESDKEVSTFVPQPLLFRVGRRPYIPDCFYTKAGKRFLVEIKPRGEFDESMRRPLTDFCKLQGVTFSVLSNESLLEQEVKAINWLYIIQVLLLTKEIETSGEEKTIWNKLLADHEKELGDIVLMTGTEKDFRHQVALFRLAHRGVLQFDDEIGINPATRVCLCG